MQQFLSAVGRKSSIVNLDPANETTGYESALDVRSLVRLEDVMREHGLGPNGGVLFALEELELEMGEEWLEEGLRGLGGRSHEGVFIFVFLSRLLCGFLGGDMVGLMCAVGLCRGV